MKKLASIMFRTKKQLDMWEFRQFSKDFYWENQAAKKIYNQLLNLDLDFVILEEFLNKRKE